MKIRKDAPQRVREAVERLSSYIVCTRQHTTKGLTIQNNTHQWALLYRDVLLGATEIAMLFDIATEMNAGVELNRHPDGLSFVTIYFPKTKEEFQAHIQERVRRRATM